MTVMQRRFQTVLWLAILGLTVSGAINWMVLASTYKKIGPHANALIGTKVLLAFVLFGIIIAQGGGLIARSKMWLMVNVHVAAIIILLGSILRQLRLDYAAVIAG
jgi:low affinity Fe/Cu permease